MTFGRLLNGVLAVAMLLVLAPRTSSAQPLGTERQDRVGPDRASVSGTVLDPTAVGIPRAEVTLTPIDGTQSRSCTSGSDGEFTFSGLSPGSYRVRVQAPGFEVFTTNPFAIATEQVFRLPPIRLTIAGLSTSVVVRPTEAIAEEQIKAQERQRLFGFIPNFYVSYVPDAAPMTSRQKRSLAFHEALDWTAFAGVTVSAAIQQARNTYPGYGGGASGYAKRWAAGFATERSHELLSHYVFMSLFHEDPRYFYQGTGGTRSRLAHALSRGVIARSDTGRTMPDYARLFGNLAAAGLSNLYYPQRDRGVGLLLTNVLIGMAGRAGQGVIQEFVAKRLTRHVPASASPGGR